MTFKSWTGYLQFLQKTIHHGNAPWSLFKFDFVNQNATYHSEITLLSWQIRVLFEGVKMINQKLWVTIIKPRLLLTNSMAHETRKIYKGSPINRIWDESTQFLVLIPIALRSITILSSHLCLVFFKGLFPVEILKTLLPSSVRATWHTHLNLLDLITL